MVIAGEGRRGRRPSRGGVEVCKWFPYEVEDVRLTIFFVVYTPETVLVFEELSLFVCC